MYKDTPPFFMKRGEEAFKGGENTLNGRKDGSNVRSNAEIVRFGGFIDGEDRLYLPSSRKKRPLPAFFPSFERPYPTFEALKRPFEPFIPPDLLLEPPHVA